MNALMRKREAKWERQIMMLLGLIKRCVTHGLQLDGMAPDELRESGLGSVRDLAEGYIHGWKSAAAFEDKHGWVKPMHILGGPDRVHAYTRGYRKGHQDYVERAAPLWTAPTGRVEAWLAPAA